MKLKAEMMTRLIKKHHLLWIGLVILVLVSSACTDSGGELRPLQAGSSPERIFSAEPQLVTFSELQAHPEDYKDRLIRVTGSYFRLEKLPCYPVSGYGAEWMLVSEDLRLDAVGYERLLRLISDGQILTVDGFFRLYEGPLGCGKDAPLTTAWFLEVEQIVQPNPLVKAFGRPVGNGTSEAGLPLATLTGTGIAPPGTVVPATEPPLQTSVPTSTPIPSREGTMVPTVTGTQTPTGTRPGTTTPTLTPTDHGTVTTTVTPTQTPTPSPSGTPGATSTTGPLPTQPPLPTTYPGSTPVPTSGYP